MGYKFTPIQPDELRPISEVVLQNLREAILENKFAPGERLIENVIAESMGVSRTPVREALRNLSVEGLAVNIPRKGTVVKGISEKDSIEIYDIREALEGLCARLACQNINRKSIKELKDILSDMDKCINGKESENLFGLHKELNNIILYATENKRLIQQMEHIYEYTSRLRVVSLDDKNAQLEALEEHTKIVDSIEQGNEALAEKLAREHVKKAKQRFVDLINNDKNSSKVDKKSIQ